MNYFELTPAVYLKNDVPFDIAGNLLGNLINATMYKVDFLRDLHKLNQFKYYCHGSLFPIEKEKVYKKGNVYTFKIRTLDKKFAEAVRNNIKIVENDNFSVLAVECLAKKHTYISNIYSVTPVVVTMEKNKSWVKEDDFMVLQNRLISNLEKKYNSYYGESLKMNDSMISRIDLMNRKPMLVKYKNTKFLGNKFKIWFNESLESQKLAFIALSCGLGEKNSSCGAGFCLGGQNG